MVSPPLDGNVFIYRPNAQPLKLKESFWQQVSAVLNGSISLETLYTNLSSSNLLLKHLRNEQDLLQWLINEGVIELHGESNDSGLLDGGITTVDKHNATEGQNKDHMKRPFDSLTSRNLDLRRFPVFIRVTRNYKLLPYIRFILISLSILAFPLAWLFYFGNLNPLARKLNEISNIGLTLLSVAILFLIMSTTSSVFTLILRRLHGINQGLLTFKLLAGFNPICTTEELPDSSKTAVSRSQYSFLAVANLLFYLSLFSISVLALYIFSQSTQSIINFPSALFVVITICTVYSIWQIVPAPGSAAYILLTEYGIFPKNSIGRSIRAINVYVQNLIETPSLSSLTPSKQNKKYVIFGFTILLVLAVRITFVIAWVLPSIANELPVIGSYSSSYIAYIVLIASTIYYFYNTVVKPNKHLLKNMHIPASSFKKMTIGRSKKTVNQDDMYSRLESSSQRNAYSVSGLRKLQQYIYAKYTPKKRRFIAFIIIFSLLLPFRASVSGRALVVEGNSLSMTNPDSYPVFVEQILYSGPSKKPIGDNEIIARLRSPQLETDIFSERQNIISLKSAIQKTRTSIESYSKGSSYQYLSDRDDELSQARAQLDAAKKSEQSLRRQLQILSSQISAYKSLVQSGSVSQIQYQDKVLAYQQAESDYHEAVASVSNASSSIALAKRAKLLDQGEKLSETNAQLQDDLKSQTAELSQSQERLRDLLRRERLLEMRMPFDGVVDTDTRDLEGKWFSSGSEIISVKSIPLTRVSANIPEYDRSRLEVGQKASLRLYSKWNQSFSGYVDNISPTTIEDNSLEYVEIFIRLNNHLPPSLINASGYVKVQTGWTCMLRYLFEPILRFFVVDGWSLLP